MTPGRKWEDVEQELFGDVGTDDREVAALVAQMDAEAEAYEVTLAEIRRLQGLTQVEMAERLGVAQSQIWRIESGRDHKLSTLRRYVETVGGQLDLVVRVPGRPAVTLELEDLDDEHADRPNG